ncbi:MAG: hypothetical protein LBQ50_05990 [Planctomycetaceae bacterium]|jgi:hypothetical protein|nr:hypothetical protein [Planctomycetaceae bacterium]
MKEILFDNIDVVVAARLGRGGGTQSGGCAALHRRLCIITSLARLKSCSTKNEIIRKIEKEFIKKLFENLFTTKN